MRYRVAVMEAVTDGVRYALFHGFDDYLWTQHLQTERIRSGCPVALVADLVQEIGEESESIDRSVLAAWRSRAARRFTALTGHPVRANDDAEFLEDALRHGLISAELIH